MWPMAGFYQTAWQPLTPSGVARFAGASLGRLFAVQLVFALLAAASVTWCVRATWFPVVQEAVEKLPEQGQVSMRRLHWTGDSPQVLAEGRCLSLGVDLDHSGDARSGADVHVELGSASVQVFSLLGFVDLPYPRGAAFALNRPALVPWWGAWSPVILAGVFAGTLVALLLSWALLAVFYCVPAWAVGWLVNRALNLRGAWRLCGAAQMPAALCLTAAVVCYGLGLFDPVRVLAVFGLHFLVSWIYVVVSPLTLHGVTTAAANPFGTGGAATPAPKPTPHRDHNPFGSSHG